MKYRTLGKKGPKVSALGLGCMTMSDGHYGNACDVNEACKVLQEAFDSGITFFDTADMYGKGENEKVVGKGIAPFRDKVILATKCALEYVPDGIRINNNPDYIKKACHNSLKRLDTDKIDLYYLHRHSVEVPIEESMQAMMELIQEGKVDYIGLSEVSPETIERAHAVLGDKLIALQSEFGMLNHEAAELVLPTCRRLGLTFVAFSPLGRGLLTGALKDRKTITAIEGSAPDFRSTLPQFREGAFEKNLALVHALAEFAKKKRCSVTQLALAWLLAQGEDIIPIPGTKRSHYLQENIGSLNVNLEQDDMASLKKIIAEHPVQGERMTERYSYFNWK